MEMDTRKAARALGQSVTDIELMIVKHLVVGIPEESVAELLDVGVGEIQEIMSADKMQELKQILAAEYARGQIETDLSYDSLEELALKNLIGEIQRNRDPDLNIKVAALANKATRRIQSGRRILDPAGAAGTRVQLTLTKRVIEQFTRKTTEGHEEIAREFRITQTSEKPSFDDIDSLLGVKNTGILEPKRVRLEGSDWESEIDLQVFGKRSLD
jgi:hypothetical protein